MMMEEEKKLACGKGELDNALHRCCFISIPGGLVYDRSVEPSAFTTPCLFIFAQSVAWLTGSQSVAPFFALVISGQPPLLVSCSLVQCKGRGRGAKGSLLRMSLGGRDSLGHERSLEYL